MLNFKDIKVESYHDIVYFYHVCVRCESGGWLYIGAGLDFTILEDAVEEVSFVAFVDANEWKNWGLFLVFGECSWI